MALEAGTVVGPYRILGPLGAGGMGEVYRARDTRLDRLVAIKILPDSFATDAERVARFEREAKTLAAVNHPNVAQIYGLEEFAGHRALAMEFVEGDNLAERLSHGAFSLDDALAIARQVADGLEAAHGLGIVHRDLKPSNIQLRTDGTAKILDFGLAKAVATASTSADAMSSPTITSPAMTERGVVLGTAAYMSPEQAKGRPVDKRADIWAFGAVLYEMVTGRRAFSGEDVSETMAAVLRLEPDWSRVPPQLHRLLKACLEKDPRKRLHDIADWSRLIDESSVLTTAAVAQRVRWLPWLVAAAALMAAAAISVVHFREQAPEPSVLHFRVPPAEGQTFESGMALSPDGRAFAFTARDTNGTTRIWRRDFDAPDARPIAGTEGASTVHWSPDGRSLLFKVDRQIKRIDLSGGTPTTIFESDLPAGAGGLGSSAWSSAGVILIGGQTSGVVRQVSTLGGTPVAVTQIEESRREVSHGLPVFLPDGRHFLYFRVSRDPQYRGVYVGSLDTKPQEQSLTPLMLSDHAVQLGRGGAFANHLLFLQKGTLMAQTFDVDRRSLTGEPFVVAEQVANNGASGLFSISASGTLAYRTGPRSEGRLPARMTWMDRQGKPSGVVGDATGFTSLRLAPDGKRAIFRDSSITSPDLWIMELERGISTRLTSSPENDFSPVWSSDRTRVVYTSGRLPANTIVERNLNSSTVEQLVANDKGKQTTDWSSDARFILFQEFTDSTPPDVWLLPLAGARQPIPLLASAAAEYGARFAPDMRSIGYISTESGRPEVYVRAFDPANPGLLSAGPTRLSKDGGTELRWRHDGKEIIFMSPQGDLMSVALQPKGPSLPTKLFALSPDSLWDFHSEGNRFLVTVPETTIGSGLIDVVMNWKPR